MRIWFFLFFASIFLEAKPLVQIDYNYYDIYPTNKHRLEESMDKTSPLASLGSVRHGTVNWKIKYYYKREKKNGICSINEVKTKVKILYTVPKLAKDHNSPKGTRQVFNRYYVILKNYLDKHKEYAVNAANKIEQELVKTPINSNCDILKADAKKIAKAILKKYKKKHKDYEIRTYEGFLEGVKQEKVL